MKRSAIRVAAVFLALTAVLLPTLASAQTVNRPVSQFFRWDFSESLTNTSTTIYSHSFFVPFNPSGRPKFNVAYLDVSLTGDAQGTAGTTRESLGCLLDSVKICPPGGGTFAGGSGLVPLNVSDGIDSEDHDMTYHWCVPIKSAGTHTLSLTLASNSGSFVFVEGGFANIELANLPSSVACTAAPDL